jgi:hypothetical protein
VFTYQVDPHSSDSRTTLLVSISEGRAQEEVRQPQAPLARQQEQREGRRPGDDGEHDVVRGHRGLAQAEEGPVVGGMAIGTEREVALQGNGALPARPLLYTTPFA